MTFGVAFAASWDAQAQAQADVRAIPDNNGRGFDTHLFRPSLDSKGFFHSNGTDILGKNDLSLGLVIDYGSTLLRVAGKGQADRHLINHSFQGTFQLNYGIANALVVGLALPVNLMSGSAQVDAAGGPAQTGSTPDAQGATRQWFTEPLSAQAVPFVAAHAKVRLLRVE